MSLRDSLLWTTAVAFARSRASVKRLTGIQLKGVGFLLRQMRRPRELSARGFRWHFDPRIASCYPAMLEGRFEEQETHDLLKYIVQHAPAPFAFVDVGASIGEMVLEVGRSPKVTSIVAFEPHPVCASVLRTNLALNGVNADVRTDLVGTGEPQPYVIDLKEVQQSGIRAGASEDFTPTVRLDDVLEINGECVMLIDVEGAEADVMRGAQSIIQRVKPLIVFEYHDQTRRFFSLDDARAILGPNYDILRLRGDGWLDRHTESHTWNCVAVERTSTWYPLCQRRIRNA